ncbi:uncharacterized protein LOC129738614 [Uranotaenia lowii]|uniref:uncharacterized protein LOC129738614 n=1 Tax=Uranotaenia lowii TaxID=190385 RepID=UPI0024788E8E|nr:uncharacterized protein LOC129738614 [Uranotaenia lowii]
MCQNSGTRIGRIFLALTDGERIGAPNPSRTDSNCWNQHLSLWQTPLRLTTGSMQSLQLSLYFHTTGTFLRTPGRCTKYAQQSAQNQVLFSSQWLILGGIGGLEFGFHQRIRISR